MNVIGQKRLMRRIEIFKEFPRFAMLVGERGGGKKLIAKYIAEKFELNYVFVGIGVDDVRQMISTANRSTIPTLYVFADADKMSASAKNALLKITEETPGTAYILMTLVDEMSVPATLRSRACQFRLDKYIPTELYKYYVQRYDQEPSPLICEICETPGEAELIADCDEAFRDFVASVADNLGEVSDSNAFKIGEKIKFKESDVYKFNLELFWKAFRAEMMRRASSDSGLLIPMYVRCAAITSEYLKDLKITGINKLMAFDMWIVDIRRALWT